MNHSKDDLHKNENHERAIISSSSFIPPKTYWIHQVWWPFTPEASQEPPLKYHENIQSWITKNPNAYHKIWNKQDALQLLQSDYPWYVDKWLDFKREIYRSDAIRPFILHKYGGVYADMDSVCYQCFENFIKEAPIIIGNECGYPLLNLFYNKVFLENAILTSRAPHHPFWIHYAQCMTNDDNVLKATGPCMLSEAYYSFKDNGDIWVIDRNVFYPIPLSVSVFPIASKFYTKEFMESMEFGLNFNKNAMASHQYDGSWKKDQNWKKKRINFMFTTITIVVIISVIIVILLAKKNKSLKK